MCKDSAYKSYTLVLLVINSSAPGKCGCNRRLVILKLISRLYIYINWTFPVKLPFYVKATKPHRWLVNSSLGNDLVMSGNKPLPELTALYLNTCWPRCIDVCHHMVSLGQNKLKQIRKWSCLAVYLFIVNQQKYNYFFRHRCKNYPNKQPVRIQYPVAIVVWFTLLLHCHFVQASSVVLYNSQLGVTRGAPVKIILAANRHDYVCQKMGI